MARYPYISERNISKGMDEIYYYVNDVTGGWVSNMILIGVFLVTFFGVYSVRKDFGESFGAAGFLLFFVSLLFWLANFISGLTFSITLAVSIISFGIMWVVKR